MTMDERDAIQKMQTDLVRTCTNVRIREPFEVMHNKARLLITSLEQRWKIQLSKLMIVRYLEKCRTLVMYCCNCNDDNLSIRA